MQIIAKGLSYKYTDQNNIHFPDFSLESGQQLLILGNSGIGKSTLLHLLGLLLAPSQGVLYFDKQDTTGYSQTQLTAFRAQNIGIIFQKPHFVQSLSALKNVELSCFLAKKSFDNTYFEETSQLLAIDKLLHKNVFELSVGEQQRLGILRSLMVKPKLLLADEPTSSLDDGNCQKVVSLLLKQSQSIAASLVVVSHDQRLMSQISNKIILQ